MPIAAYYFNSLLAGKYKLRWLVLIYVLSGCAARAILIPFWDIYFIRMPVMVASIVLPTLFLFDGEGKKKLLYLAVFLFCDLIGEFAAYFVAVYLFGFKVDINDTSYQRIISEIVCYSFVFACALASIRIIKGDGIVFDEKSQHIFFYYAVAEIFSICFTISIFSHHKSATAVAAAFTALGILISIVLAVQLFRNAAENRRVRRQEEFMLEEEVLRDRHYEELKNQYEKFARLRHDFNAHINALDIMQAKGETQEMTEYIAHMKEEFEKAGSIRYSNIPILDAIIFSKKEEAQSLGIETKFSVAKLEKNHISDYELCSLASNMIQNAIEGAEKFAGKKFITMDCFEKAGFFVMSVRNSADPPQKDLSTSKEDKSEHGIGTKIIRSIAEKNDGNAVFRYSDGVFECIANLSLSQKDPEQGGTDNGTS